MQITNTSDDNAIFGTLPTKKTVSFACVMSSGVSKLFAGETKSLLGSAKFVSIDEDPFRTSDV